MDARVNRTFESYDHILKRFGVSAEHLKQLDNEIAVPLKQILADLENAMKAFSDEELSTYALINWAQILAGKRANDQQILNKLFSGSIRCANTGAKHAESTMIGLYLLMSLAGLVLNLIAIDAPNLDRDTINSQACGAWNYLNAFGGLMLAWRYWRQGETRLATVHLLNSALLTGCTVAANSLKYGSLIHVAASTISGLIGFSYAVSLSIGAAMECYEARQCNKRILALNKRLKILDITDDERFSLQKMIMIEKAQRANHMRSAKASAACAVVMLTSAIVIYLILSGVSFGSIPAATMVLAATALVTGLLRKVWVNHQNYAANAKKVLTPPVPKAPAEEKRQQAIPIRRQPSHEPESNQALLQDVAAIAEFELEQPTLFERLQVGILKDPYKRAGFLDTNLTIPGKCLFKAKVITFRDYLTEMARKDPAKLEKIVKAIEGGVMHDVITALSEHRNGVLTGGWGKTTGQRIAEQLLEDTRTAPEGAAAMQKGAKRTGRIEIRESSTGFAEFDHASSYKRPSLIPS